MEVCAPFHDTGSKKQESRPLRRLNFSYRTIKSPVLLDFLVGQHCINIDVCVWRRRWDSPLSHPPLAHTARWLGRLRSPAAKTAPLERFLYAASNPFHLYRPIQKTTPCVAFCIGGEGGIWTHAPVNPVYSLSRGAPYSHLGTSPYVVLLEMLAEREGFEPPVPFSITSFQD